MAVAATDYKTIIDDYFLTDWQAHPVLATAAGIHFGDGKIDDVSQQAHDATIRRLYETLAKLHRVAPSSLTRLQQDDRNVLLAAINGKLLEEEAVQRWRHDPDSYVSLASNAVYTLIARDFAPLPDRMKSAVARELAIPDMLVQAKRNLSDVPAVFLDIALEDIEGAVRLVVLDAPAAFAAVEDPLLKTQLANSAETAAAALRGYKVYLQALRLQAHGSFVLGPNNLQRLLASDLVDIPFTIVLAAGKAQLQRDQAAFRTLERKLNANDPPTALALIGRDHPDTAGIVSAARNQLISLQKFIRQHDILSLPQDTLPTVAETPVFQRAVIFAEMDAPGPFEALATTAYYYITPPDDKLSVAEQESYLAYLNRPMLQNLSVHEVLPGHYVQYLASEAHPEWSLIRKAAQSYTATEGWAHYGEQMMLDEGLGDGDPKLRLAQLQDALLRDCRLIVSIGMHAQSMTLETATKLMETECYQPAVVAYKEARRGTEDPGYFSYTLGKLEILKLRSDVEQAEGKNFSLRRFHDRFLAAGLVPISIIRREILGRDGPAL